jgi:hypothetical protein
MQRHCEGQSNLWKWANWIGWLCPKQATKTIENEETAKASMSKTCSNSS